MITAHSTPNIAFIKYWGNRNNELRLPAADSLSMTLDTPSVKMIIDHADALSVNGSENARFQQTIELIQEYLKKLGAENALPASVTIEIDSQIPPGIGLASSAAVFSCLAKAIAGLIEDQVQLTDEQISVMARFGSGSAARSIFSGFSGVRAGDGNAIDAAIGFQVADENHWLLHDIVIAPSTTHKKVSSSEGHPLAKTSPHWEERLRQIPRRQEECIDAILRKDFEKLQIVAEEDCMDMHKVMETSTPSLKYLNDETHRIIGEIEQLRTSKHLPVLYTMDAGPTVHLFCEEEALDDIVSYAKEQSGCTIFQAKVGSGACLSREELAHSAG